MLGLKLKLNDSSFLVEIPLPEAVCFAERIVA